MSTNEMHAGVHLAGPAAAEMRLLLQQDAPSAAFTFVCILCFILFAGRGGAGGNKMKVTLGRCFVYNASFFWLCFFACKGVTQGNKSCSLRSSLLFN